MSVLGPLRPCIMTSWFNGDNILNWYSIYFPLLPILVALGVSPIEAKDSITSWGRTEYGLRQRRCCSASDFQNRTLKHVSETGASPGLHLKEAGFVRRKMICGFQRARSQKTWHILYSQPCRVERHQEGGNTFLGWRMELAGMWRRLEIRNERVTEIPHSRWVEEHLHGESPGTLPLVWNLGRKLRGSGPCSGACLGRYSPEMMLPPPSLQSFHMT